MNRKEKVKRLRERLQANLRAIENTDNVKIDVSSASYSDEYVTFKVNVYELDANGEPLTPERKYWKMYAHMDGLDHLNVGDTVKVGRGRTGVITGYNPSAPKFVVLFKDDDGREYKATSELILLLNPKSKADVKQ
jgi:hypothetical protein